MAAMDVTTPNIVRDWAITSSGRGATAPSLTGRFRAHAAAQFLFDPY
jgi:hypothetical protein